MSGKMARNKGARGEREVAEILEGRRTGQMQSQNGSTEADVEAGLPGWNENFHTEVKRQERVEIVKWCEQSQADAGEKIPLVVWRRNHDKWRVTLPLDDFLGLVHKAHVNGWSKDS